MELIRRSQANNRRAINYATKKMSASAAYAKALYTIRLVAHATVEAAIQYVNLFGVRFLKLSTRF